MRKVMRNIVVFLGLLVENVGVIGSDVKCENIYFATIS